MFIKSWNSNSIRGQQLDSALQAHEHRMVGSRIYSERYIKKYAYIEYENIAIPDKILMNFNFNNEITLQTNHIERRKIKKYRYWLVEKTFEHKWNKYKDKDETKLILEMPIKELGELEYRAYKEKQWNEEINKFRKSYD